ncbi:hypothetical protein RDI58_013744 [Solanum bulbocastanum]|uniref:Uncharacterized protein n=1 Tax=Solanum bulbocastanum TaxID=147425 RepID=A0AAN8TLM8_SOLBU
MYNSSQMSMITISSLVTIFLLFHACNARSLGLLNKSEEINPSMSRVSIPSGSDLEVEVSKKNKKREAEYNLDYLPPRTHPPSHN